MKRKAILIVGSLLLAIVAVSLAFRPGAKSRNDQKTDLWKVTYTVPAPATNPPAKTNR